MAETSEGACHQTWYDAQPVALLLSAARLAFNVRALVFSAVAITLVAIGWHLLGWAFKDSQDKAIVAAVQEYKAWPWHDPLAVFPTDQYFRPVGLAPRSPMQVMPGAVEPQPPLPPSMPYASVPYEGTIVPPPSGVFAFQRVPAAPTVAFVDLRHWLHDNPLVLAWRTLQRPFWQMFQPGTTWTQFAFLLLAGLWALVVWAFFGGVVTRLVAVALARGEQLPTSQLLGFATAKWRSYFMAPVFPLLCALLVTIFLAIFGLLLHTGITLLLAGLFWFLALFGGLILAVLLIPLLFGWPLMWATISTEGTDSFDAFSRSYSYTYQRPLHYLLYALVAAVLGVLAWVVVAIFATAVIQLSLWAVGWGSGAGALKDAWPLAAVDSKSDLSSVSRYGIWLITFWVNVVWTLAVAFLFSYFWSATTAIYFLLRLQVDAAELDDVYLPEDDQPYGLPPLRSDAAGVPAVADEPGQPE